MNRRDYIKNTAAALGLTLTGISMSEMLLSCQTQAKLDWKPVFFTNNQAALIVEIAETILPKTKTPGAKEMIRGNGYVVEEKNVKQLRNKLKILIEDKNIYAMNKAWFEMLWEIATD